MATAPQTRTEKQMPVRLPMQHRAFNVRAEESTADDSALVSISFSSSNPVKRMSWSGMWWYEVLSHDKGAVMTDRLSQGISVLVNHDTNQRAGILQDGAIDGDKGTGKIRFNTTQFGKDVATEVREGTLPFISVGYIVHAESRVADIDPEDDEDDDYLGTFEASSWEPVEVSLVAIPADPTVGVGRDLSAVPQYPVRFAGMPANPPVETGRSKETTTMATVAVVTDHTEMLKTERERTAGIALLQRQFPDILTRELAEKAINEGTSRNDVAAAVLEKKREKEATLNAGGQVQLSAKERSSYDFMRVMRMVASGNSGTAEEAGLELEISQTIAKKLGRDTAGVFIPTTEPIFRLTSEEQLRRRTISAGAAGSTTGGGATVAIELVSFLDLLRPAIRLGQLGADFLGGMTSNFTLPKMTADVGFNWVAEAPGVDNTDVDPNFGQVPFSPLGATASTSWSRQLMVQSSIDIEAKVRNALVRRAAIGIETAALAGSGGTQPTGLLTTAGVNVVAIGTNGGQPTKGTYVDLLTKCEVANAFLGEQKYLVTPEMAGYLAKTAELANTIALPIYTYGQDGNGIINGHEAYRSNLLPKNLVKGTSGAVCHASIGGSWSALTVAEWGAMEIILDPYTKARQQLINIIANFLVNSGCTYPQAFAVNLDGIPL